MDLRNLKLKKLITLKPKPKTKPLRKKRIVKIDPHHCRCFSIPKQNFREFVFKLQNLGYSEPLFEQDHRQIIGLTRRLSEHYQIHVKLMRTGRIEAEIEYPQDYPMAHLNPTHSYSAHAELALLLNSLQIPNKCKRKPPLSCLQRQIIQAQQPTHRDSFLVLGGIGALIDLAVNDGKITSAVLDVAAKQVKKNLRRKLKRRRYFE